MRKNKKINKMNILLISLFVFIVFVSIFSPRLREQISDTVFSMKNFIPHKIQKKSFTPPKLSVLHQIPENFSSSDNESFTNGWTIYSLDGNLKLQNSFDKMEIQINNSGSTNANYLYRQGLPIIKDKTYEIYFDGQSSIERNLKIEVINTETQEILFSENFTISQPQNFQFHFQAEQTSNNGELRLYLGSDLEEIKNNFHSVTIQKLRMIPNLETTQVRINQLGYRVNQPKTCVFPFDAGDVFDLVDANTNQVVYTSSIMNRKYDEFTDEYTYYGDFTAFNKAGTYYIRSQIGSISLPFNINENPYENVLLAAQKFFYFQRSGMELEKEYAGELSHFADHMTPAILYGTENSIDVSGGWFDAGDYGRYIKTGAKSVNDLLLAYISNPKSFDGDNNIPESNNDKPDILDEVKYELDWMLKMQDTDGGVYNKVLTKNPAETVAPQDDTQTMFVLDKETTATASFAGTMALASFAYQQYDETYAKKCLDASILANDYLEQHLDHIDKKNPSEINGGQYLDDSDKDNRFFAKATLYFVTNDSIYLQQARDLFYADQSVADNISWNNIGGYGRYLLLQSKKLKETDEQFYSDLLNSLTKEADLYLSTSDSNNYHSSTYIYGWGSNGMIVENGIVMLMAYDFTENENYAKAAIEQINYVLGKNTLNMSFVTGYGQIFPNNPHSRISKALNAPLLGAMVGGPNSFREDIITKQMSPDLKPAKLYADVYESYSSNEVSIYWNSAFVYLLSRIIE